MRPTLIVTSHGNMAAETLNSAKMIVGEMENVFVVSMRDDDGLAGTAEKFDAILAKLNPETEIVVLADLKGGTPCNVAMMKASANPTMEVVSGLNLGMLIEGLFSQMETAQELAEYLENIGKNAVDHLEKVLPDEDDEEYEE
ncbi:PTS sugar transporter subunit IIA [Enterococcus hulanensis]|uniref:PTS sugar transporter subunit IIA n=1 Tax=Enterococcus hulanensis TaxID=2559929 RepID=A0ABU3EZF2_9ENTE|nr:PTS sugar transporter subunit IIA [Enterococcus hulanensis]MDT2600265.1 PTS sugar transporter subunit IIA [Enterococcus hulanensis]MDT2609078.1 PTS sugar transporter subunit IIA [Enterococcus hulanensis]MDT2616880.1 PTS sugar transporter subunit IIA [Enterococcus hulanensis]MDT2628600.1 PTS sugar transporter subunit IIA [Enterococcus hulanensis]MDT2655940.1 PTS sugar transporter subunit IIA [Enterococcus hulanensis]